MNINCINIKSFIFLMESFVILIVSVSEIRYEYLLYLLF